MSWRWAAASGLNVPIVVLNDGWLSLLRVKQERKGYGLSGVDLGDAAAVTAALLRRALPRRPRRVASWPKRWSGPWRWTARA